MHASESNFAKHTGAAAAEIDLLCTAEQDKLHQARHFPEVGGLFYSQQHTSFTTQLFT